MEKNKRTNINTDKSKEEDRDLWYKNTANRTSRRPEDQPSVTWMEYFDLMDAYRTDIN